MNLTRRELKFQIPLALVEPLSRYMEPYCEMDKYSILSPDSYYTINSLYLDNDHMYLLENKRRNLPRRFSLRIRSYGDNPVYPAFFEIKAKADMLINKQRAPITCPETVAFLRDGTGGSETPDLAHPVLRRACYHMLRLGCRPKIMTQYKRKAYFGRYDVYSRVTFDRRMRCYPEPEFHIFPDFSRFKNYDHAGQYVADDACVVLELKCELKIPSWMSAMIRQFELRQMQFSKYDSSWSYVSDEPAAWADACMGAVRV